MKDDIVKFRKELSDRRKDITRSSDYLKNIYSGVNPIDNDIPLQPIITNRFSKSVLGSCK